MKIRVLLHYYYSPSELEKAIESWVHHYNNERYHESLNNMSPADVYYGRDEEILKRRQLIKEKTLYFAAVNIYLTMYKNVNQKKLFLPPNYNNNNR